MGMVQLTPWWPSGYGTICVCVKKIIQIHMGYYMHTGTPNVNGLRSMEIFLKQGKE